MTAIAVDYSTSGFAVAADGKARWVAEDDTDDVTARRDGLAAQKIFTIRDRRRMMAYALSGTAYSEDLRFSLVKEAERSAGLLSVLDFDDPRAYIRRFSAQIKQAYEQARRNGHFKTFSTDSASAIEGGLFQIGRIIFAGYFDGEPFVGIATIAHKDQFIQDSIVEAWTPTEGAWPLISGSPIIPRMMFEEGDRRFARYVILPRAGSSLDEAVARVKACVEAQCSKEATEIDPFCRELVGGHVHVATVTPKEGFKWHIPPLAQ
jgi:hypothetical protein